MKKNIVTTGIIIFVVCSCIVGIYFFVDIAMRKNYNDIMLATTSDVRYDMVIKGFDDAGIYALETLGEEKIEEILEEYDKKVAAGIFPDYSQY